MVGNTSGKMVLIHRMYEQKQGAVFKLKGSESKCSHYNRRSLYSSTVL